jgi:hypothetical protein
MIKKQTHTQSRYNQKSTREILQERSKKLRKSVYEIDETLKDTLSSKNIVATLEDKINYCQKFINVIEKMSK